MWQPIETAPKDGACILVAEYGDVKVAEWFRTLSCWLGPYDGNGDPEVMYPTHWMPLPEPPSE